MPKKGGKKGKGKAKVLDWGEIVREQYVTIEVCHAALRCCTAASSFESSSTRVWPRWQMRNAKWHSMCFKHTMAVSEPVPASPRAPSQHHLHRTPASAACKPPQPRATPASVRRDPSPVPSQPPTSQHDLRRIPRATARQHASLAAAACQHNLRRTPAWPQPACQLSSATLAAAGGRAALRAPGAAQAGRQPGPEALRGRERER